MNNSEIKVGEYVRNKDGYIGKIKGIIYVELRKENYYMCENNAIMASGFKENIVKHSSNIIDLIECGDYVNGYKVSYKESTLLFTDVEGIDRSGYHIPISQYGEGIKSIVTKEQFSSVEYRLEE